MSYQLTVLLSDDEYAQLEMDAAHSGTTIEALAHVRLIQPSSAAPLAGKRAVLDSLYAHGIIANIPSYESDAPEEEADIDRLAQLLGEGKSASDMVIEDRGPY